MRILLLLTGTLLLVGCGDKQTAEPEKSPTPDSQKSDEAAKWERMQQDFLSKATPLTQEELALREKQWARNKSLAELHKQIADIQWALKSLNSYPTLNPEQIEYKKRLEQQLPQLTVQAANLEKADGNEN
jgi:hypothetical protein